MRKILALCLTVIMVVSCFAMTVSAEEETTANVVMGATATYEKPGKTYVDVNPALTGSASGEAVTYTSDSFTVGASETIVATANMTGPFYDRNGGDFSVLGYKFNITKKTGTIVYLSLTKDGNSLTDTIEYTKKASAAFGSSSNGYVTKSVKLTMILTPNTVSVKINDETVFDSISIENRTNTGVLYCNAASTNYTNKIGAVSVATQATTISKTNFLLDKTFTSADTLESIGADGYSLTKMNGVSTADGLYYSGSVAKHGVTYDGAKFGGAYTAEVEFHATTNPSEFIFNLNDDGTSYYKVWNNHNNSAGKLFRIDKVVDGTATILNSEVISSTYIGCKMKYVVKVAPLDNGDVSITVDAYADGNLSKTLTAVDELTEATDEVAANTPLTSGKIKYYTGYSTSKLFGFKVYPTPAEGASVPRYTGSFQIGGADVNAISKGNTSFKFPVAMIGQTPDFIVALYEDYEMTDIKVVDVLDINDGLVSLFDTTDSTAENISIRVFVWNSLEGMVPVIETYVLD